MEISMIVFAIAVAAFLQQPEDVSTATYTAPGYKTATDLHRDCTSGVGNSLEQVRRMSCLAYLSGFADLSQIIPLLVYRNTGRPLGVLCLPEGTKPGDLRVAYIDGFTRNPGLRTGGAGWAAALILSEKFPCAK